MENKRKVGGVVIMHPDHNNYGTSLQGFATVKVMEKLGYPFRIIRYRKKRTLGEWARTAPGLIRSGAGKEALFRVYQKLFKRFHPGYNRLIGERTRTVNRFKARYFDSISDYYTGYRALCEGSRNYDVIFVGSDQVWGPLSLYSRFYNLLFVDERVPRFSYASSFGVSRIFKWQQAGTKAYLDKMDAVGVREIRGKEIVDSLSRHQAKVVADPTMLLTRREWEACASGSAAGLDEPYILSYILGPRKDIRQEIMELGRQTGLKVVAFRHMDWYEPADEAFGDVPLYDADPLDFIRLLDRAEYVCTDSFHGTVFSILFHKKFLTFYRQVPTASKSTHSRIDSLLALFGLQERLFAGEAPRQIVREIDYSGVDEILDKLREESAGFLKQCIEIRK